jgi:hypothetical protein
MINLFINEKEENKVYYCKHIAPGVCAYQDETIFIGEDTLKKMDKSFSGKPIFVNHQTVNPDTEKEDAVGYVVESFYLPEDGTHWAKLLIIDDKGHEAIKQGWKVSNAYKPTGFGVGGEWHNVPYNREVTDAYYTHLALVDNPRYEEAEIMSAEDFKKYKEAKKSQLEQLQNSKVENSKQGEKKMFKLWTKKEVTNSDDISKVMVELSDGSAVSIGEMVNSVEKDLKEKEDKKNECHNEDELMEKVVKVNGEDMKVSDLVAAFEKKDKKNEDDEEDEDKEKKDKKNGNIDESDGLTKEESRAMDKAEKYMSSKKNKKNAEEVDKRKEIDEVGGFLKDKGLTDEDIRFVMKKMEKDAYEKDEEGKDNEEDEEKKEEEKKDKKNSKDLLNAEEKANSKKFVGVVADTMARKLARGEERYGSAK